MLVIVRVHLNKESESAKGILCLNYFRNFLKGCDNLVIHGSFFHGDTDIDTEFITKRFGQHVIAGTGDNTVIEHFLNALVHRSTANTTLLGYFLEGDTGTLGNNFEDFAIQFVYLFHPFVLKC